MSFPPKKRLANADGLTLSEILIGLAIVSILILLLSRTLSSTTQHTRKAKCLFNLKTISIASSAYSADHRGAWPPSDVGGGGKSANIFSNSLMPYLGLISGRDEPGFMKSPLVCPSAEINMEESLYRYRGIYTPTSYTYPNGHFVRRYGLSYAQNIYLPGKASPIPNRQSVQMPASLMTYIEQDGHYVATLDTFSDEDRLAILKERHAGLLHCAFADGSVRLLPLSQITDNQNRPTSPFWNGQPR